MGVGFVLVLGTEQGLPQGVDKLIRTKTSTIPY